MIKPPRETIYLWLECYRRHRAGKQSDRAGMAVAAVCTMTDYWLFDGTQSGSLLYLLRNVPRVIVYGKDFLILEKYNKFAPIAKSLQILDVQESIEEAGCDFRPFFEKSVGCTLGKEVPNYSVKQYFAGKLDELFMAVRKKSELLKELYCFIQSNGYVMTQHKDGGPVKKVKLSFQVNHKEEDNGKIDRQGFQRSELRCDRESEEGCGCGEQEVQERVSQGERDDE